MDYKKINRDSWNQRLDAHVSSEFYNMEAFLNGKSSLNKPELELLGDVTGKSILHLQCHFGQDSISLARNGALVTGVDLSDKAIEKAREINSTCGTTAQFVISDIFELPANLEGHFDIVFTSYGTIGWLPDLDEWAGVINHFLKPGGKFVFAEFHPVVWMYDDDFNEVFYNYFTSDAIIESQTGTYADRDADFTIQYVSWNHGLAEVITSLLKQGLILQHFEELDYSPYNCFRGTVEDEPGVYRIEKFGKKIPMMYTLCAQKP